MKKLLSYIANFLVLLGLVLLIWILSNNFSLGYLSWYHLLPYLLLLIVFGINFYKNQKRILQDVYYNLAILFSAIYLHIVIFRTVFDEAMVVKNLFASRLNLIYLGNNILPLTILFSVLVIINLILMYKINNDKLKD